MTVSRLFNKVVYAGYVEAPAWGVSVRKGEDEGLIGFETHERILKTLEGKARPAARRDFNEDFPLRGHVLCNECGNAMTSAWSKGCRQHYAYYRCMTRGCGEKNKSIPRGKIEDEFAAILKSLQPTKQLFALVRAMLQDAWEARMESASDAQLELKRQFKEIDNTIESLLDRIVDATTPSVVSAYETRLAKLEREKIVLNEKVSGALPPKGRLEECIELSLKFMSRHCKIYENICYTMGQIVPRLTLAEPLRYCRI